MTLAVAAISCAPSGELSFPKRPRQEQAEALVWGLYLEQSPSVHSPVPPVDWVFGVRLDCGKDGDVRRGFMSETSDGYECVMGTFDDFAGDLGLARIALWDQGLPFSQTSFSHELYHGIQDQLGIYDPRHQSPAFAPGGLVARADAMLSASGL